MINTIKINELEETNSISNDDYEVSDFTRNNRCKEIAEELKMKMIK